jgi:hypothetical protein
MRRVTGGTSCSTLDPPNDCNLDRLSGRDWDGVVRNWLGDRIRFAPAALLLAPQRCSSIQNFREEGQEIAKQRVFRNSANLASKEQRFIELRKTVLRSKSTEV